jgi:predicted kinase
VRLKTLYIVRGPSGAGKSHYVKNRLLFNGKQAVVCSADDFFMRPGTVEMGGLGVYDFDVRKLPEAHADCMGKVIQAMTLERECIVVDNTHTRRWEYDNYVLLGQLAGYKVEIIEIVPQTVDEMRLCASRNSHGVPDSTVASMVVRFEPDARAIRVPMARCQT